MKAMSLIGWIIISVVEVVLGIVVLGVRAFRVVVDLGRHSRHALHVEIRCPATPPHVLESEGRWRCTACGFVYDGSVWVCPFCRAVTPHVSCPTCGLSIESPFRAGKKA